MARIPEHEIERLKAEVSVERLAEARGIRLERRGADLVGLCPFHEDHNPSLIMTPAKNLWHCLGCEKGGSVIDWVEKAHGVSFRHAIELLRANHPSLSAPGAIVSKGITAAVKLDAPFKLDVDDQSALNQVVDYYHQTLKQSPEALRYLQSRGLEYPEMIEHFRLGFSNRTLGYRLPDRNRKDGAEIRGRLQRLGIIRESGHEHFTGSVVVPVIDLDGNVTEIYGRKITEGLRAGTPLHTYLPGPHKGVWNEQALTVSKEIILCESLIDALSFWCADYRFSRRDIRQYTGWADTQLRVHLGRLEGLEYLLVHRGGRGQSFVYELVFERSDNDERPVFPGLIDVEKLKIQRYDEKNAGLNGEFAGSKRPQNGGIAGRSRGKPEPIRTGLPEHSGQFLRKDIDAGLREKEPVVIIAAGGR